MYYIFCEVFRVMGNFVAVALWLSDVFLFLATSTLWLMLQLNHAVGKDLNVQQNRDDALEIALFSNTLSLVVYEG